MEVKGHLALFNDFLTSWMFKVRVGSAVSNTFEQQEGVPQGSVLRFTLFGIAMNNIAEDIPSVIKKIWFVDDLVIYLSSSSIPSIERNFQLAINKISSWTRKKKVSKFRKQKVLQFIFIAKEVYNRNSTSIWMGTEFLSNPRLYF